MSDALIHDVAIMSGIMIVSHIIKANSRFLHRFFVPTSMLAGMIALVAGPYFLNVIRFSEGASSYAYTLVLFLFAGLFLGRTEGAGLKKTIQKVGDTLFLSLAGELGQFGLATLAGTVLMVVFFPDVEVGFSILMPSGFVGGHGYAAAIGGTIADVTGWENALYIAQTFATIGLLMAIIGGVFLINFAVRRGETAFVDAGHLSLDKAEVCFIPEGQRPLLGREVTNSTAIDTLTWHVILFMAATGIGYLINYYWNKVLPNFQPPMICLTMFGGFLIQTILNKTPYGHYVDKETVNHFNGLITDFLVAFGIATINIDVIIRYIVPIAVLSLLGLAFSFLHAMVIGKRLFRKYPFERGIFMFGWATGVVAMGVTLLRIVDPKGESGTLEDYGMAYVFISIVEVFLISLLPLAVIISHQAAMAAGGVLMAAYFLLLWAAYRLRKQPEGG